MTPSPPAQIGVVMLRRLDGQTPPPPRLAVVSRSSQGRDAALQSPVAAVDV
nr:hypothetical protein Itr_chr03CG11910 [Ipomoea trifida]GLL45013.1 hypothetical protein Itr_chr13CG17610 [Ipomoea trifida]